VRLRRCSLNACITSSKKFRPSSQNMERQQTQSTARAAFELLWP
jgi:hypothetical protein